MKKSISKKIALLVALGVPTSFACANDLMKTENYYPGGKYSIGSRYARKNPTIEKVQNTVRLTGVQSYDMGSIHKDVQVYGGNIRYERRFEDHPLSEHGSWGRVGKPIQVNELKGTIINGNYGILNATIVGTEDHPQNAYNAEDGGDHPYDVYSYGVKGTVTVTSHRMQDLPKPLPNYPNYPYNPKTDNGNNQGQPENNSGDDGRSHDNHDLAGMPNDGSPDNSNQFNSDSDNPYNQDLTQNGGGWENVQALPPYYGYNNSPQQQGGEQDGNGVSGSGAVGYNFVAIAGLGLEGDISFNADGSITIAGGILAGPAAEIKGTGYLEGSIGQGSKDGIYGAGCGSIGGGAVGGTSCAGFSSNGGKYVSGSVDIGPDLGGGVYGKIGYAKTFNKPNKQKGNQ